MTEGYFFTDRFVFRLVRADVLLGKLSDELDIRISILSELEEFEALPTSPEILEHLMVRVNHIWKRGMLTNAFFEGMDYDFEIRKTSTNEVLARGYAKEKFDLSPLHWFYKNVHPDCAITLYYD